MARLEPYNAGESIKLRSYGRGTRLFVVTPSGMELSIPAPSGTYNLWLPEVGRWVVQWDQGEVEHLEVVPAIEPEPEVVELPKRPLPSGNFATGRPQ
jgi:hypothetical protein